MATLVLSAAGAAAGSAFGGSVLGLSAGVFGRAAGATVGRIIDQKILGVGSDAVETGQVDRFRLTGAAEGAPIGNVWGRLRVAGQVIWASRFRETTTTTGSGKGGPPRPKVTEYSYDVSLAVALCEGEIAGVGRIWADGAEIDVNDVSMRLYRGTEAQQPDPTIVAIEGDAPAYRGTAYVVFEHLDLGRFGNRVPNFTFEVIRGVVSKDASRPDLSSHVQGVALMPGTGEYSLATTEVRYDIAPGVSRSANVNTPRGGTDFAVSLDALRRELPECRSVSLIVSWFGDDLRCGRCRVEPKVEQRDVEGAEMPWSVADATRADAGTITQVDGRPVYGGTPSDAAVVEAIRALADEGIGVVFYPFLLMEQLPGNGRPDPWTGAGDQPPFPWRGRITLSKAPGRAGSPDRTSDAEAEVSAFFGRASPADFEVSAGRVRYVGSPDSGYRRFILHYAHLCVLAGGVDAFCVGSEMRALTQIRGDQDVFPAVDALRALVRDVRAIVGPDVKISYAADWSEYFGYHPQDGSGDVYFHLDPLWADPDVDFIGIDNYMRLSDWRDGDDHADAASGAIYDLDYLRSNVAGGEGYDWYYASDADRAAQVRTAITDGAHNEPWVFRYKDLRRWWGRDHHERRGGARRKKATAWVPKSKPIWFTEYGCPAVDKGTNEPNKFYDPKSSESAVPLQSSGVRDDLIQMQYVRATLSFWNEPDNNPKSPLYQGRMVDMARAHLWAWDARPFPAFPSDRATWSDGPNHHLGHWITGRATNVPLDLLVEAIVRRAGVSNYDVSRLYGIVRGYSSSGVASGRASLQPLMLAYGFDAVERNGRIVFRNRTGRIDGALNEARIAAGGEPGRDVEVTRSAEAETAGRLRLTFVDADADYATRAEEAILPDEEGRGVASSEMPLVLSRGEARAIVERWLAEARIGRETASWAMPQSARPLGAGDVVTLPGGGRRYRIDRVEQTDRLMVEAVRVEPDIYRSGPRSEPASAIRSHTPPSPVVPLFLDLPLLTGAEIPHAPHLAVTARPWTGSVACWASEDAETFELDTVLDRAATVGRLLDPVKPAMSAIWDRQAPVRVELIAGELSSVDPSRLYRGANLAALGDGIGPWELMQFAEATLEAPRTYRVSTLLRGQAGTDAAAPRSWPPGTWFVLVDRALRQTALTTGQRGRMRTYRIGPAGKGPASLLARTVVRSFEGAGLRPFAPAHLRVSRDGADLHISWLRRGRIDADGWDDEIPLGEAFERYRVDVRVGEELRRRVDVRTPHWTYTAAARAADGADAAFAVDVAQISDRFGAGPTKRIEIDG